MNKTTYRKFLVVLCITQSLFSGSVKQFKKPVDDTQYRVHESKLPIVYSKKYDVSFGWLLDPLVNKLHPFDGRRPSNIAQFLANKGISSHRFYKPRMVTDAELKSVHTQKYLDSLNNSRSIARIVEVLLLALVPNRFLQWAMLTPMKWATGGTIKATELLQNYNWSINLGGGFHHAKCNCGGGFCVFGDIQLAVKKFREQHPDAKIMIVDFDAHQGNGHESDFMHDDHVTIFDIYGGDNYPQDYPAREKIKYNYPIAFGTGDKQYLKLIKDNLPNAMQETKPDFVIYNAGTDILTGDRLGGMNVSIKGVVKRDQIVFEEALKNNAKILMLPSGGYTKNSAVAIAASIHNLLKNVLEITTS